MITYILIFDKSYGLDVFTFCLLCFINFIIIY